MMTTTDLLVRRARRSAGLSQHELAARLRTTQSAISRLEQRGANPRVETLAKVLSACGQELALEAHPHHSSVDESQIADRLRLSPGERIKSFERSYANIREIALAGARSRAELA